MRPEFSMFVMGEGELWRIDDTWCKVDFAPREDGTLRLLW